MGLGASAPGAANGSLTTTGQQLRGRGLADVECRCRALELALSGQGVKQLQNAEPRPGS